VTIGPSDSGVKVTEVTEGSPAEKSGLKTDDVITGIDGKKVASGEDLRGVLGGKKPGDEVTVEVLRGEETVKLKVKLGRRG
jgi:S1-C subfamily serine protease